MLSAINQHITGKAPSRFVLLLCVAVLVSASVAFGAVEFARPTVQPNTVAKGRGVLGPPGPTVAHPLASGAQQVSMAQATAKFGSPLALPSTSAVQPADAGPVWEIGGSGGTWVAITFPSKGIFIVYSTQVASDPAGHLQAMSANLPGSDLVQLNGTTPALYVTGNDGSGTNWVEFETDGADIRVFGNDDEVTLKAIAQSILTQLTSSSSP